MNFFQQERILRHWTNSYTFRGYRLVLATPDEVVMIKGRPVRHWLHFVLTLFTAGLWLLVWAPLCLWGGERQVTIIAAHGYVDIQQGPRDYYP